VIEAIQKLTPIAWDDVVVRDLIESDIDPMIDYFYEKTRPLPFKHLDPAKRTPEAEWRQSMLDRIASGDFSKAPAVIVDYKGKAIGYHPLTPIHDKWADFHAHFWDADARGKGIGLISTYKACDVFFKRFGFERIYFKPPKDNPRSSAAAAKMPFRKLPDEILTNPMLVPGIVAHVYEITREEFYALV
jgi:RimJ/RimL family protein N-acetyltransferase